MNYIKTKKGIVKLTNEELNSLKPAPSYKELRKNAYGTIEKQLEFIVENGFDAWQQKVWTIKCKYPKPKKLMGK